MFLFAQKFMTATGVDDFLQGEQPCQPDGKSARAKSPFERAGGQRKHFAASARDEKSGC
jgi:hypothetical protein